MEFDSTFWVAISFIIFFGVLIYFKIPRKINDALDTKISEIKNELDESENYLNRLAKARKNYLGS
jgi:F-type H+-transporting ATPase subunit b